MKGVGKMTEQRLFRLRVHYEKKGRLALLSHLELIHALERCVRRANLPFAVTQGFSPHMKIAFGSALPVGVGGLEEVFDVHLTRYIPAQEALQALQQASVPDLMPFSCSYIEGKAPAASVAYPVSEYQAVLAAQPTGFCVPETLTLKKKNGFKDVRVSDFLQESPRIEGCQVTFSLKQTQAGSLRADAFLKACLASCEEPVGIVSLTRVSQRS